MSWNHTWNLEYQGSRCSRPSLQAYSVLTYADTASLGVPLGLTRSPCSGCPGRAGPVLWGRLGVWHDCSAEAATVMPATVVGRPVCVICIGRLGKRFVSHGFCHCARSSLRCSGTPRFAICFKFGLPLPMARPPARHSGWAIRIPLSASAPWLQMSVMIIK